jgi:hypothetical protein
MDWIRQLIRLESSSSHEGHLRRHDGHEWYVRFERQILFVDNDLSNMMGIPGSFWNDLSIGLIYALKHTLCHKYGLILNINLTATCPMSTTIQLGELGLPANPRMPCLLIRQEDCQCPYCWTIHPGRSPNRSLVCAFWAMSYRPTNACEPFGDGMWRSYLQIFPAVDRPEAISFLHLILLYGCHTVLKRKWERNS